MRDSPGDSGSEGFPEVPEGGHAGGATSSVAAGMTVGPAARRYARWMPAALIAAGVVVDLAVPPEYTPSAVFAAAPLVAAPLLSARATFLCGLAALLTLLLLLFVVGAPRFSESLMRVITVLTVSVLALGINYLVRRSDQQLASARSIAESAQLAVLPAPPAHIGGLDIAARYQAAQTDARIGGDLYAVQDTPYGVRLIVGDVRGKGMGSVEAVAVVLGAFREAAEEEPTLEGLTERLERALKREGGRRRGLDDFEGFTTATIAEVPKGRPGRLRIVNRGHPAPVLLSGSAAVYLEPSRPALPLGLSELGAWPDRVDETHLPMGAQLLLYTDGLSETRDDCGHFYDPALHLTGRTFAGPEVLLDALVSDMTAFSGGSATDDMALLAVERRAWPPRPELTGGGRGTDD